jgi:hypothetical protein
MTCPKIHIVEEDVGVEGCMWPDVDAFDAVVAKGPFLPGVEVGGV